jgi:hypothetical protein
MSAMNLTEACSNILAQLTDLVDQIREGDFVKPAETLSRFHDRPASQAYARIFSCALSMALTKDLLTMTRGPTINLLRVINFGVGFHRKDIRFCQ